MKYIFHHGDRTVGVVDKAVVLEQSVKLRKPHILIDGKKYKHCSYCDSWKLITDFHNRQESWDSKAHHCKDCAIYLSNMSKGVK